MKTALYGGVVSLKKQGYCGCCPKGTLVDWWILYAREMLIETPCGAVWEFTNNSDRMICFNVKGH